MNDDLSKMDITNVIALDTLELQDVGPTDVKFRTLAVSAGHNLTHAATADTVNIADLRGGKIYPGNSALGEVTEVGANVTKFAPGDIVITHCNGAPDLWLSLESGRTTARLDRLVRRVRRRRLAARARPARVRTESLGDRRPAPACPDRLSPWRGPRASFA